MTRLRREVLTTTVWSLSTDTTIVVVCVSGKDMNDAERYDATHCYYPPCSCDVRGGGRDEQTDLPTLVTIYESAPIATETLDNDKARESLKDEEGGRGPAECLPPEGCRESEIWVAVFCREEIEAEQKQKWVNRNLEERESS